MPCRNYDTTREEVAQELDSQDEWTSVLPTNGICDSNQVKFDFTTKELKEGSHRIAVKVEDIYGNVGYGTVTAQVGK